jgi:hypothetical protein
MWLYENHRIVQCNGCETIGFMKATADSEDIDPEDGSPMPRTEAFPKRLAGRSKLKSRDLTSVPFEVQDVYEETYQALCHELRILAAIGIRATVEAVCKDNKASGDKLPQKMEYLVGNGTITEAQKTILMSLKNMGDESAHEVQRHSMDKLDTAFDVVENLLQNIYIMPWKAEKFT